MRELQRRKFSLENTLYNMVVTDNGQDNTTYIIVPRQLQVHPLTMEPISCNYLAYQKGQRMRIPIEFTNQDQNVDIKRGSFVLRISRYIEVQCFGDVPACINADVANISSGRSIKLNDLSFPRGVVPYKTVTPNFVAGKQLYSHRYTHILTCIDTCTYTLVHTYTHTFLHTYSRAYIHTCKCRYSNNRIDLIDIDMYTRIILKTNIFYNNSLQAFTYIFSTTFIYYQYLLFLLLSFLLL